MRHGLGDADADTVFVAADRSDLQRTVWYLNGHSDVAKKIAQRQRYFVCGEGESFF
ncbi:hypothetical protein F5B17DRAFT_415308 [Nemania serpens]|nr:hypothetical protein F5B17DRAFT_415308 [Nemania serpens]